MPSNWDSIIGVIDTGWLAREWMLCDSTWKATVSRGSKPIKTRIILAEPLRIIPGILTRHEQFHYWQQWLMFVRHRKIKNRSIAFFCLCKWSTWLTKQYFWSFSSWQTSFLSLPCVTLVPPVKSLDQIAARRTPETAYIMIRIWPKLDMVEFFSTLPSYYKISRPRQKRREIWRGGYGKSHVHILHLGGR